MLKKAKPRTVSVRLSDSDYAKLEKHAVSAGLKPGVLARMLVTTGLNSPVEDRRNRLGRLEQIWTESDEAWRKSGLPGFDAVAVINEGREERTQQMMDVILGRDRD